MNRQLVGFCISLFMHGAVVVLAANLGSIFPMEKKTMVIDFTVTQAAPLPVEQEIAQLQPPPVPQPKQEIKPKPKPKPVVKKEVIPFAKKVDPLAPEPEPEPEPEPIATIEPDEDLLDEPDMDERIPEDPQPVSQMVAAVAPPQPAPENAEQIYLKAHFLYIREEIQEKIVYPRVARRMGWEGRVVVSFVVCANGDVEEVKVVESSGFPVLDKRALSTIRDACPFPKPPVRAELVVPIVFRLG